MLLPLLALSQANPVVDASAVVNLYRGAAVYGSATPATYQDVEDTYLDRSTPDTPHGGDYTLLGGEGKTILIRFGDLANAIGRDARVLDATLILTETSSDKVALQSVGTVAAQWGEGPFKTLGILPKPGVEPPKDNPNAFAATWKSRRAGAGWQSGGATGRDVAAISGAAGSLHENHFEIAGLGAAVNSMLADPGSNHGFALTFAGDAEFFSSEAPIGKPRLLISIAPGGASSSGDVVVQSISPAAGGYAATLKNRGMEPVSGLRGAWNVDAQPPERASVKDTLAPGETAQVRFEGSVRSNANDHRFGALTLRIESGPNDRHLADKELSLYTAGIPVSALVTRDALAALDDAPSARGRGAANWIQSQIDFVNDTVLARSRYSFATDGCRERVRLAELKEVGPLVDGPAPIGVPVEVTIPSGGPKRLDFDFIHRLLVAIGAPDLGATTFPLGSPGVQLAGWAQGGIPVCPDLTGGGDTRYDGGIARQSLLPQIPSSDPILSSPGLEPTGLLSATGVGALNALLGVSLAGRTGAAVAASGVLPATTLVSVADAAGQALPNMDLAFYQSHEGRIAAEPVFAMSTGASGTLLLARRKFPDGGVGNVFGSRNLVSDGAFLVKATRPGSSGWGWLKAWQLTDAAFRGDTEFASVPLRVFMESASIDRAANHAKGRSVRDSTGSLPAKLAGLVDGVGATSVELPQRAGDWVEIDLNRDWTLAELRLTALGQSPWRRFAIKVYQTGEKPTNAVEWGSETDWAWSAKNRGVAGPDNRVSVSYAGSPVQIRYIRLICLEAGRGGLAQIEAFSSRAGG
ncbi:MAG TPA: hypothetical protein VKT78_07335 [Fimbriimonadaceae bacterium]|nr:hypothetical protein [Fimbriimonadaceae bacterium]